MKIQGKKITGPNIEIIIIPRGDERDDIILKAEAILDMKVFDAVCPRPKPPIKRLASGDEVPNIKDSGFIRQIEKYAEKKLAWMLIESLQATEGLEWEKVDISDNTTWHLYKEELNEAGFSDTEVQRILNGVTTVNALNEDKINEARERFLRSQQAALSVPSFQKDEENSTQSGELASK